VYRIPVLGSGRILYAQTDDDRDFNRLDNLLEDIDASCIFAAKETPIIKRETLN